LHDAVVVGAGTIVADDPQLTTRLVPGPSPVRVILDPQRRSSPASRVFSDDAATTLLIAAAEAGGPPQHGRARVLFVPADNGSFDLGQVVQRLAALGLHRLFVEGGGTTVSRFFDAGLLDRLQIAVAPVLTGRGKPGLRLAANDRLADCPRPQHRVYAMGRDFLFDCELRRDPPRSAEVDARAGDPGPDPAGATRGPPQASPIRRIR